MSSNRLMYDTCAEQTRINQSAGTAGYLLDSDKYENVNKCRNGFGLIGGSNVSHISGNIVDLESDLYGITRKASMCPDEKFFSKCSLEDINNCQPNDILIRGNESTEERVISTDLLHLPTCNIVDYPPVVLPKKIKINKIIK
tara:strand:+ start:251 stop:676 length:426 start_codon:yes stop_codon:yes gene_type:complete